MKGYVTFDLPRPIAIGIQFLTVLIFSTPSSSENFYLAAIYYQQTDCTSVVAILLQVFNFYR